MYTLGMAGYEYKTLLVHEQRATILCFPFGLFMESRSFELFESVRLQTVPKQLGKFTEFMNV